MSHEKMPSIFVGHGAPLIAIDETKGADLRRWAADLVKPRALLVVSAHWEQSPVTIGTVSRLPLMYDFSGFPAALREVTYDAPAAPELADQVRSLWGDAPPAARQRPWDHGVWTPLVHMFPQRDVPILQLSLPSQGGASAAFTLGQRLAPLRQQGVLLVGSGSLTHNLRALGADGDAPDAWAAELDAWVAETMAGRNWDALLDAPNQAPAFRQNHPTVEHWLPVIFAVGAATEGAATFPVTGFEFRNISRRCIQLG